MNKQKNGKLTQFIWLCLPLLSKVDYSAPGHQTNWQSNTIHQADGEIMVEPGNLVPSQKINLAAIFKQNSRAKLKNMQ